MLLKSESEPDFGRIDGESEDAALLAAEARQVDEFSDFEEVVPSAAQPDVVLAPVVFLDPETPDWIPFCTGIVEILRHVARTRLEMATSLTILEGARQLARQRHGVTQLEWRGLLIQAHACLLPEQSRRLNDLHAYRSSSGTLDT